MKNYIVVISILMLLTFSACGSTKTDKPDDTHSSTSTIKTSDPKKTDDIKKSSPAYPYIANERDPNIKLYLVGNPMEAYFASDEYKVKADSNSSNPIYSKDSFIKGTYPLDESKLDYKTARVIIIQFKEDVDVNYLFNKEKPAISIIYGKKGKDVTEQYNFTYDCVTQKLLITNKSAGTGFGSGNFIEVIINGDNLSTAEIQDTNVSYADGRSEIIKGQRSRKLSGKYSFKFYL